LAACPGLNRGFPVTQRLTFGRRFAIAKSRVLGDKSPAVRTH
jgi:hypothetical protein